MEQIMKMLPFGADTLVVPFTFEREVRPREARAGAVNGLAPDGEGREVTDDRRL